MRDFLAEPAWTEEDLGVPLPDSPHACSVCLPTWNAVVGYEEGRDKVMRKLQAGYPRFVRNPLVARASARAAEELGESGEEVFLFPTKQAAQRAQRWVERRAETAARAVACGSLQALVVPREAMAAATEYQRFTGELVSSRMAEDFVQGELREQSKSHLLERRLAKLYDVDPGHVSVFGSGMSAVTAVLRSLPGGREGKKTLQLEFPYVDSLKIQETIGHGAVFLNEAEGESFDEALGRIRRGEFAAVFTEIPTNPMLRCVDLVRVAAACREGGTPLVVDDSAVGPSNVRLLPFADVVTCSLTKWLSYAGDVMGGAVVLRPESEFSEELGAALADEARNTAPMYVRDVEVMLSNLKGYPARMQKPNQAALELVGFLAEHPAVAEVWHPSRGGRATYEPLRSPRGGFGPLLSFALRNPRKTPKVYDALRVSKGPSFGTRFTIACPYVLLAHYRELEWADACGVPARLIRVSCGEEPAPVLIERFRDALRMA